MKMFVGDYFENRRCLASILCSVLCAVLLIVFCGTPAQGQAQVPTGTIVGTVTDSSGAVIPGATVTATNTGTNITTTAVTDTAGNYTVPLLQVGTYSVAVEAKGFSRFVTTAVALSAGTTVRVDAKMQVGQTSQTVEVSGTSAPLLQTDSSTMSATLVPAQVENLPLNGRNFINLVRTTPGVNEGGMTSLGSGTRPDDRRQSSTISANGQPDFVNNYEVDGMDNNERMIGTIGVRPSIDAIQEINVQTNLYTANQTRTAGAVVNIITKSGTNQFHGSLYEFVRNDVFDAKDYFNQPQPGNPLAGAKPEYRQNQFGGSVGGPIIKNKTFFFADYEDLRIVQGIPTSTNVPSPCELGAVACNGYQGLGNFSDLLPDTVIYNPVTQQPYSYNGIANVIPPTEINPISAEYAQLFPTNSSCSTPSTCLFNDSPNRTQFASTFDIRIDQHFTDRTYLYGRYSFNNENTFTPGALPAVNVKTTSGSTIKVQPGEEPGAYSFPGPNNERTQNLALSLTHTFSQDLVGQLTGSFTRIHILSQPLNIGVNVNNAFGGPPVNNNAAANEAGTGLAPVQINGYGQLGSDQYIPLEYLDNTFQYSGNLILTRGNHSINLGLGLIRRQSVLAQSPDPLGLFTFTGVLTNSQEGNPNTGTGGNGFAQFLSGYMDNANRQLQLNVPSTRSWEPSAYIEDDWRATKRLTLNLGVRYDIFTPFTERHNYMSNFDPTVPSVLNGGQVIIAGQGGWGPTAGIVTDHKDVAPRLGFAATMPHDMVIRGGFGMSYFPTNFFTGAPLPNQPFESVSVINSEFGQSTGYVPPQFGASLGAPIPTTTCLTDACETAQTGAPFPSGTINAVYQAEAFNYKPAYAYQYSLEVQKVVANSTLTVGYVGSTDHRLQTTFNVDAPLPPMGPGGCGTTQAISLPFPSCQPYGAQLPLVSGLYENMSTGEFSYNGAEIDFRHTGSQGLTYDTNYTYGRALANASTGGSGGGLYGLIPLDPAYDWGNAQLDMRHRWTGTVSYALPFGKSMTGFAGEAVKGWSVNTLIIWASGLPVTVANGYNPQINNGSNPDRPNVVGPLYPANKNINEWFNIAAFAPQAFGTAGNEHNNQIYGPSGKSVAFSLFKDFPIKENITLQFRAETFNLFNTPVFAEPNTTINGVDSNGVPTNAGQFGSITETNSNFPARQIQFALKLLF
jgi:hypothetical protein